MSDSKRKAFQRQLNQGKAMWEISATTDNKNDEIFSKHKDDKGSQVSPLPKDFSPDPAFVEFLEMHHGITKDFVLSQLPEFKLYWLETGEARKAWQSRFKNHVIYHWRRQQREGQQERSQPSPEELADRSWAQKYRFDFDE